MTEDWDNPRPRGGYQPKGNVTPKLPTTGSGVKPYRAGAGQMTKPLEALNAVRLGSGFRRNKEPKCPHCGEDYDIKEREAWDLYSEGEHEVDCPTCGLGFNVVSVASYTFSTDEQGDPE